jgi:hypothetical protein
MVDNFQALTRDEHTRQTDSRAGADVDSYDAGYKLGYRDAIEDVLERFRVIAETSTGPAGRAVADAFADEVRRVHEVAQSTSSA